MDKIILTGATGFIGGHIVSAALARQSEVFCVVRKSSNLAQITHPGVKFLYWHPGEPEKLDAEMAAFVKEYGQPDYFIHNAGITKSLHPADFEEINARHTHNYARGCLRNFTSLKRFLLMSSLAAMGPGDEKTLNPIAVHHTPNPNTLYGASKLMAEKLLRETVGLRYVILRPTGVYGPNERDYYLYLKSIKSGIEPVVGFAEQQLSFVYVTDLVEAVFLALKKPVEGEIFLISDGNNYTGTEYGKLTRSALQRKAIRVKIPTSIICAISHLLVTLGRLTGKIPTLNYDKYLTMKALNWHVDISETRKRLEYNPQIDLKTGLIMCVKWYRENGWL